MKALANTLLRDPATGDLVTVGAGDEVPEWAVGVLGDHLVAHDDIAAAEALDDDAAPAAAPDESWTVANLRDWAKAHDVDLHGATSKADILAVIKG